MLLLETLRSSTFRLALICVGLFGAAIFALFGYVYWSTVSYLRARSDRAVVAEQAMLLEAYDTAGREGLIALINQRIDDRRSDGAIYLLAAPSFGAMAGNLRTWPAALQGATGWGEFSNPDAEATPSPRLRGAYRVLADGDHLLVGQDLRELDEFLQRIRTGLAGGALLIFILAAFAGASVTRRTVGRIEAINATSREIMSRGLGKRIPLRGTRDEWDKLAENLNSMLDRIEGLVQELKQVSDNVAHDLRTPLTRMRARLERAYGQRLEVDQFQAVLGDSMSELDRVLRTFASLLRISQIEAVDRKVAFRTVDLAEIAGEVVELFDPAAEEKAGCLAFVVAGRVPVSGDRDLLFDAMANLVDNAIKHGGAAKIAVEVKCDDGGPVISVADRGPGIPVEERANVFRRFYRLEQSRSAPGNGLGLSLVAAVAHIHGARIRMADNAPGLRIELHFPPARS